MPACFWELCHCPEATPCKEHQGTNCGTWNGALVQKLTDVSDRITRDAELGIVALDKDTAARDALRARLDARRAELQRESDELQQQLQAARTLGDRARVVIRVRDGYSRLDGIERELRQALADLDSLNTRTSSAGALIGTYLIAPYTSAAGYCACYDTKRARLAAIANQRSQEAASLAPLFSRRGANAAQIFGLLSGMPSMSNQFQKLGSLSLLLAIVMYLVLGTALWVTVFVTLLLVALMLTLVLLDTIAIDQGIAVIRRRIVKLDLAYYRAQEISTCQRPPAAAGDAHGNKERENAWYEKLGLHEAPAD